MNTALLGYSKARSVAKVSILLTGILLIPVCWGTDFTQIKQNLVARYPSVTMVDANRLYQQLNSKEKDYIVLDVRSPKEYAVSHIYQSQNAPNMEQALKILRDKSRQTPILVYCSLGYRSAELALELQEYGYSEVTNLAGSLFEWVEQGYPVYQEEREVKKAHPYNLWWGRHLRSDYRSYRP